MNLTYLQPEYLMLYLWGILVVAFIWLCWKDWRK